jgi:hypothetical protein
MDRIQIDMFEVQLGAGLLLQFRDRNRIIRVLADAGVHASNYPLNHVHRKLDSALAAFGGKDRRIDLIIGTHYDADHLKGLVPIIEDESIAITEAWMPPVANDIDPHALEDEPKDERFLAHQFAAKDGERKLAAYLDRKQEVCEAAAEREHAADSFRKGLRRDMKTKALSRSAGDDSGDDALAYFTAHRRDAAATLGESESSHADQDFLLPIQAKLGAAEGSSAFSRSLDQEVEDRALILDMTKAKARWKADPGRAETEARSLAFIRESTAKEAITAIYLAKVVKALAARKVPIVCRTIDDGQPQRFVWDRRQRRFIPSRQIVTRSPELMLLGPSVGLVKKYWDRLPIGDYMALAHKARIPVRSITPSNELSYVVRMQFAGQGLLISGDAGCVDFRPGDGKPFYPALLSALLPLHVVQVAHHGGRNAHFYNVLLDAGYAQQTDHSWLLLSHKTDDKNRPSSIFGSFVAEVRKSGDDVKLLFTSRPRLDKVRDFTALIAPSTSPPADVGDVRMVFDRRWRVVNHAIKVE